jgi:hypothetical protein
MATIPRSESASHRRGPDPHVAAAIDLGRRVAALYALSP